MGKSKDRRDVFYRQAKQLGYRARSAFKLLHIDEEFQLIDSLKKEAVNGKIRAVDLCGAPGSWSQVLSRRLWDEGEDKESEVRIVNVDLQETAPIPGVKCIQGDITSQQTAEEVVKSFGDNLCELVVSDGAPDVTGLHEMDEYLQAQLLLAALNIATFLLKPGGAFLAKVFRGKNVNLLYTQLRHFFKLVTIAKPKSSRNSSYESFVVCQQYTPPKGYVPCMMTPMMGLADDSKDTKDGEGVVLKPGINTCLVPFVVCGDLSGFDSDMSYSLKDDESYKECAPTQLPINPSYKTAVNLKKNRGSQATKSV